VVSSEAFLVVDLAVPLATISPVLVALEGDMVCSYLSLTLLLGVGAYAVVGWWWADPVGALAMLPIILWQGWETLAEARERADRKD
jgi:divalent metal cation (Fe/Co/Zn/Cd) transporter